jgi:hypothetical protein
MSSVRDWTTGFAVIGTILLGPMIAFLTVVAAEVLIDFLKERAVIAVCAVVRGNLDRKPATMRMGIRHRGIGMIVATSTVVQGRKWFSNAAARRSGHMRDPDDASAGYGCVGVKN